MLNRIIMRNKYQLGHVHRPRSLYAGQNLALIAVSSTAAVCAIAASKHAVYSGILSAIVFASVSALVPEWRVNSRALVCPANWAIFAFGLQLVVMPTVVSVYGPEFGSLPVMPSQGAIEAAILLSTLAFLSFMVGYVLTVRSRSDVTVLNEWAYHSGLVFPFLVVGLIGFIAAFGSDFSALFLPVEKHPEVSQMRGLIGTIFRPFLAFSLIIVWAKKIDQQALTGRWSRAALTTAIFGTAVAGLLATHGLGRNLIIVPLLAMAAAYGLRVRRLPLRGVLAGSLAIAVLSVAIGAYRQVSRAQDVNLRDPSSQQRLFDAIHVSSNVQVYGNGPQFLGFLIEKSDWGRRLWWGSPLLGSFLEPVPELGKPFRNTSGTAIYNEWLYGSSSFQDQIVPFQGELFMNFHIPGVVLGYFLLGVFVAALHCSFMDSRSALSAYVIQFMAAWAAFLVQGGITSVAYVAVTFSWPLLLYGAFDRLARNRKRVSEGQRLSVRWIVGCERQSSGPNGRAALQIHGKVLTP
jgi:hypothetical protein